MPELQFPTVALYLSRLGQYGFPIRSRRIENAFDVSGDLIRAFNDGFEYSCSKSDASEWYAGELRILTGREGGPFVSAAASDSLYRLLLDEIGTKGVHELRDDAAGFKRKLIFIEGRRVVSSSTNMEYSFVLPARSLVEKFRS